MVKLTHLSSIVPTYSRVVDFKFGGSLLKKVETLIFFQNSKNMCTRVVIPIYIILSIINTKNSNIMCTDILVPTYTLLSRINIKKQWYNVYSDTGSYIYLYIWANVMLRGFKYTCWHVYFWFQTGRSQHRSILFCSILGSMYSSSRLCDSCWRCNLLVAIFLMLHSWLNTYNHC